LTVKSSHYATGLRKSSKVWFQPSVFDIFGTVSFYITKTITNLPICDFAKSDHNEDGYRKLQSPSLAGFFVTICDLVYLYTSRGYSTDLLK
jgi:hypothetical protein